MYGAVMEKERKDGTSAVRSTGRPYGRENRTGIPTQLKERMERSTGLSFDDVRVHYNSALPARLDALAYTQGNQVEIGPGQERHLPHELGHVVQQKLGAVRANATHSSGVALNTDPALEHQADEIGAGKKLAIVQRMRNNSIIQRCGDEEDSPEEEEEDKSQEQESQEQSPSSGSPGPDVEIGAGRTYSNLDDGLNFSNRASEHMRESCRQVPMQTLQDAIRNGEAMADPRGSNATMYYTTMHKDGKMYNLEVLYDKKTNTVYHFMYARKAMGNLPAISK